MALFINGSADSFVVLLIWKAVEVILLGTYIFATRKYGF